MGDAILVSWRHYLGINHDLFHHVRTKSGTQRESSTALSASDGVRRFPQSPLAVSLLGGTFTVLVLKIGAFKLQNSYFKNPLLTLEITSLITVWLYPGPLYSVTSQIDRLPSQFLCYFREQPFITWRGQEIERGSLKGFFSSKEGGWSFFFITRGEIADFPAQKPGGVLP